MSNLTPHIFSQLNYRAANLSRRSPKPSDNNKHSLSNNSQTINGFYYSNEKSNLQKSSKSPQLGPKADSRSTSPYNIRKPSKITNETTIGISSRVSEAELQEASDSLKKLKEKMKNMNLDRPTQKTERVKTLNDETENKISTRDFEVQKQRINTERVKTPETLRQKPLIQTNDYENQEQRKIFKSVIDRPNMIKEQKVQTPVNQRVIHSEKKERVAPLIQDFEPKEVFRFSQRTDKSPINNNMSNISSRTENRSKSPVTGEKSMMRTPLQFKPEKPTRVVSLFDHISSKDYADSSNDLSNTIENNLRKSRDLKLAKIRQIASKSRERSRSPMTEEKSLVKTKEIHKEKKNYPSSSPVSKTQTSFLKSIPDLISPQSHNNLSSKQEIVSLKEDIGEQKPISKPNLQKGAFSKPSFKPKTQATIPKEEEKKVKSVPKVEDVPQREIFNDENEIPDETEPLIECPQGCGRKFLENVLAKHAKVCLKVFQSKRKQFDMASQRLTEDQANIMETPSAFGKPKNKKKMNSTMKSVDKQSKWRQQSEAFRANLKASRGETLTKEEEFMRNKQDDLIQCEYCLRRFNEQAASRHIAFCKNKHKLEAVKRSSKTNSKK